MSLLHIIFLGAVRPYSSNMQNNLEIFNEICILGAAYHLLVLTEFVDSTDVQYMCGWSLIAITLFNMSVNLFIIIKTTLI